MNLCMLAKTQIGKSMSTDYIKAEAICKTLGDKAILQKLSFSIKQGEVVALVGENGIGKTTLLRLLTGIWQPDSGCVSICGEDIIQRPMKSRENIGYLPEQPALYEYLTARTYIKFFENMYQLPAGTGEDMARKMDVYNLIDRPIDKLSRGQGQLMALLAVLLPQPQVLILDEPTSGLDPVQRHKLHRIISDYAKEGRSVLLSTHSLEEARAFCDRMLVLHNGSFVADGKPNDVLPSQDARKSFMKKIGLKA